MAEADYSDKTPLLLPLLPVLDDQEQRGDVKIDFDATPSPSSDPTFSPDVTLSDVVREREWDNAPNLVGLPKANYDYAALSIDVTPGLLRREQECRVRCDGELPEQVQQITRAVSQALRNSTDGRISFRTGELKLCGSVAEGTKVGSLDEFDFQYVIDVEGLEVQPKRLLRTKPRSRNQEGRSYFSLTIPGTDAGVEEINAFEVQDCFLGVVKGALRDVLPFGFEVKKAGPAVKVVFTDRTGSTIKIDITLGIRADPKVLPHLTMLAKYLDQRGELRCHFVAAQDYWKICFVDTEQDLMREMIAKDEVKGAVYRIIKQLRDDADIKDASGDGILPSYPIKVAFMGVALRDHFQDVSWALEDVSLYIVYLLRLVEEKGSQHSLSNLFVKDDNVMGEADRSYLESRRVSQGLKDIAASCRRMQLLTGLLLCMPFYTLLVPNREDNSSWTKSVIFYLMILAFMVFVWCKNLRGLIPRSSQPTTRYMKTSLYQFLLSSFCLIAHVPRIITMFFVNADHLTQNLCRDVSIFPPNIIFLIILVHLAIASARSLHKKRAYLVDWWLPGLFTLTFLHSFKWKSPGCEKLSYRYRDFAFPYRRRIILTLVLISMLLLALFSAWVLILEISRSLSLISSGRPWPNLSMPTGAGGMDPLPLLLSVLLSLALFIPVIHLHLNLHVEDNHNSRAREFVCNGAKR